MVLMGRTPHLSPMRGITRRDKDVALAALERIGVADIAERAFNQLSGGQRQMVLIARAIAQETRLMLLDEPTSALDFSNQIRIWRIIRDLTAHGMTVLACSHDPNHVHWFCDDVVLMRDGRILAAGTPREVMNDAALEAIYPGTCAVRSVDHTPVVLPKGL
jgi:iron complex transport system ATP-binding protein